MPADCARGRAWRIEQNRVEGRGLKGERVTDADLCGQAEALQIQGEPLEPFGRAVERRHLCAGEGELRGLATGRGAEIGDPLAGPGVEQPGRKGSGGVLDPPLALGIAGQLLDRCLRGEPQGACRQQQSFRHEGRVGSGLHGEVKRRLGAVGERDLRCHLVAIGLAPARREPVRGVGEGVGRGLEVGTPAGNVAQHGIDQPREGRGAGLVAHGAHAKVDGGMIGHVHIQDLRRADQQCPFNALALFRHALFKRRRQRETECAKVAQSRQHDGAHQRPVTRIEARHRLRASARREALVE